MASDSTRTTMAALQEQWVPASTDLQGHCCIPITHLRCIGRAYLCVRLDITGVHSHFNRMGLKASFHKAPVCLASKNEQWPYFKGSDLPHSLVTLNLAQNHVKTPRVCEKRSYLPVYFANSLFYWLNQPETHVVVTNGVLVLPACVNCSQMTFPILNSTQLGFCQRFIPRLP